MVLFTWAFEPQYKFTTSFKNRIIPKIIGYFGDFTYKISGKIKEEILKKSHIIPQYNTYKSEDYIQGQFKGVVLEFVETHLIREHNKGQKTMFSGMLVLLEMNKSFKGNTIVRTGGGSVKTLFSSIDTILRTNIGDVFSQIKKTFFPTTAMEKVGLEDPRFAKMFDVYSTDQVEARYLLTPSFMERLLALAKAYDSTDIQCSFFDNKVFFTIPTHCNLFEPRPIYKSVLNMHDVYTFLDQAKHIFQIIDVLKLNRRLGL